MLRIPLLSTVSYERRTCFASVPNPSSDQPALNIWSSTFCTVKSSARCALCNHPTMASSAGVAAGQSSTFVDLTHDDDDNMPSYDHAVRDQQRDKGTTVQNVSADRLPAPTEAFGDSQISPALSQQNICRLLCMSLAPQERQVTAGTPLKPGISAVEGQDCLLDHVVMKDILRVLGDSRPDAASFAPKLYGSLQAQYLQRIPDSQAEHQGRLLVYLEWLTQRLFQHGLAAKHEMLYAAVLDMCKASQVHLHVSSAPKVKYSCTAQRLLHKTTVRD